MTEPTNQPGPGPAPETFSREYVHELREENKGLRLKASEQQQLREQAEAKAAKAQEDANHKVQQERTAFQERLVRSELKAVAVKAGIVDLDGLKLLDTSKLKLLDDGTVEGAEQLIEDAKKAKPYLFATSTSHTGDPPPPKTPAPANALDMSDADYAAAKKALTKR